MRISGEMTIGKTHPTLTYFTRVRLKMRSRSLWKEPDKIRKYSTNSTSSVRSHFLDLSKHSKRSNIDLGLNTGRETMENQSGFTLWTDAILKFAFYYDQMAILDSRRVKIPIQRFAEKIIKRLKDILKWIIETMTVRDLRSVTGLSHLSRRQ